MILNAPLPQTVRSGWLIALDMQQRAEASPCSHFPASTRVHRGTFKNKDDPRAFDGKSSPLRLLKGLRRGRARTPWSVWPDIPSDLESRSQKEGGSIKEQRSNNRKYLKSDSRHREPANANVHVCFPLPSRVGVEEGERGRRAYVGVVTSATARMDAFLL